MMATDLFTEILRWLIWIALAGMTLLVVGWISGHNIHQKVRRWERQQGRVVFDWEKDGGVDAPMVHYPRTHVAMIPDTVPEEWDELCQ